LNVRGLRHHRINILYVKTRKQDAQTLSAKFAYLGAEVTISQIADNEATEQYMGRLYYFDKTPKAKELAHYIASAVSEIENVSPQYVSSTDNQNVDCNIWLVKKNNLLLNQVTNNSGQREKLGKHKRSNQGGEKQSVTAGSKSNIILNSKRGMKVRSLMTCDSCGLTEIGLYRYSESNKGLVHICSRCKPSIFNRSFDKIDAMKLASQGGAFETNRRRH
jgi:hypothetical protein